ncbi:MAG: histidine kinase [Acidobacteriota bacterium]
MNAFNLASLINLLGFTVGISLYFLLLIMVARHRQNKRNDSFDFLLLATATLGILWNLGEVSAFIWRDFGATTVPPLLTAISYSALGFLPSVVVHSALKGVENSKGNWLTFLAYGLSVLATLLHLQSAISSDVSPSSLALQILTYGSIGVLIGLLVFNYQQTIEKKAVWAAALLIFALSTLHLNSHSEGSSWFIELIAHQSSLPLALVILYQDYRFAFADLFLKRALSLILLTLMASGLYVLVASPLLRYHETHDRNDVQAISLIIILWVATALIYPSLHKFAVWVVDKIILRRTNYENLGSKLAQKVEEKDSVETVLDLVCGSLSPALTANSVIWTEVYEKSNETKLPFVNFTPHNAEIFIPTTESPFYKINLKDFSGGRHLLSDEIEMLESVSLLTARRIDNLRVTHERCEQELREQEFSKLATEAQLSALRAQINPHFLFNALTTIGYLIQTSPDKAFDTLMRLTQLLRGVLRSTGEFSTLQEELKLIESYLDIERTRFEERLDVKIDVPKDLQKIRVPSLILQPLVENAIKHGISKIKKGGRVEISASLEATKGKVLLNLTVFDTGIGIKIDQISAGVGLNNIRDRLQNHYGDSASLDIQNVESKGTKAVLRFPVSEIEIKRNL